MPADFLEKVNTLPEPVKNILFSNGLTEQIYSTTSSYGINEQAQEKIAKLIGLIFVKDFPLERMSEILQRELPVQEGIAAGLSLSLTKTIFLPLKTFFPNAESFIATMTQKAIPPTQPPQTLGVVKEEIQNQKTNIEKLQIVPPEPELIVQQTLASALFEREEVLAKQLVTTNPIKFADSEMLKFPSVKNWLTDYLKFRNNFPDQEYSLIRAKYINDTPNTKKLSEKERLILAQIFRSYDEYTALPFSKKTGQLLVNKLEVPSSAPPKQSTAFPAPQPAAQAPPRLPAQPTGAPIQQTPAPTSQAPKQLPTQQPTPQTPPPQQKDTYREQVAPQDLAGPQAAQRPAPKLNGNIINLKELGKE